LQSFSNHAAPSSAKSAAGRRPARRKRQPGAGDTGSPEFVEALARGLSVMRCFTPETGSLGNLELAECTGLPKSTISRIVYTLTTLGYLRYHSDTGRYSPGYGVLALGFGCLASLDVRQLARPLMERLARDTGAAVALGTFDGESMTYIEAVHGSSALYLRLPAGYRAAMHSTMGRTYLATLPASERSRILASAHMPDNMAVITEKACREFAEYGCCYGLGDWQPGIHAVAAPFTALTGEGTFVISCGGPDSILPKARIRGEVKDALLEVVAALSPPVPAPGR
jgi:DNA-binding IclR family transcriptional regulator